MKLDRSKRYENSEDFFLLEGNAVMKLTTSAAVEACESAADREIIIVRVEGGNWHHPGFQPSLDCIWDGQDPPISVEGAHDNNLKAAKFIKEMSEEYDVFILTDSPISGYPHKQPSVN